MGLLWALLVGAVVAAVWAQSIALPGYYGTQATVYSGVLVAVVWCCWAGGYLFGPARRKSTSAILGRLRRRPGRRQPQRREQRERFGWDLDD